MGVVFEWSEGGGTKIYAIVRKNIITSIITKYIDNIRSKMQQWRKINVIVLT